LSNCYIDAADLLVRIAGVPVSFLVDDRVGTDGGFTGFTVTNNELALATADWGHRVDGFQTRLHGLMHWLTLQHTGCLQFQFAVGFGLGWRLCRQWAVRGG